MSRTPWAGPTGDAGCVLRCYCASCSYNTRLSIPIRAPSWVVNRGNKWHQSLYKKNGWTNQRQMAQKNQLSVLLVIYIIIKSSQFFTNVLKFLEKIMIQKECSWIKIVYNIFNNGLSILNIHKFKNDINFKKWRI